MSPFGSDSPDVAKTAEENRLARKEARLKRWKEMMLDVDAPEEGAMTEQETSAVAVLTVTVELLTETVAALTARLDALEEKSHETSAVALKATVDWLLQMYAAQKNFNEELQKKVGNLNEKVGDLIALVEWQELATVTAHINRDGPRDDATNHQLLRDTTEDSLPAHERAVMKRFDDERGARYARMPGVIWTGRNLDEIRKLCEGRATAYMDSGRLKIVQERSHNWYVSLGERVFFNEDKRRLEIDEYRYGYDGEVEENLDMYRNGQVT